MEEGGTVEALIEKMDEVAADESMDDVATEVYTGVDEKDRREAVLLTVLVDS